MKNVGSSKASAVIEKWSFAPTVLDVEAESL